MQGVYKVEEWIELHDDENGLPVRVHHFLLPTYAQGSEICVVVGLTMLDQLAYCIGADLRGKKFLR